MSDADAGGFVGFIVGILIAGAIIGVIGPKHLDGPIVITKAKRSFWEPQKILYYTDKGVFQSKGITYNVGDTLWVKK